MKQKQTPKIVEALRLTKEKKEEAKEIIQSRLDAFRIDPDVLYREKFQGNVEALRTFKEEIQKLKDKFSHNVYKKTVDKKEKRF
jgi:hypothetical protein